MAGKALDAASPAAAARWETLVQELLAGGDATYGNRGGSQRAFGATSLKTDGRIFAMLVKDRLVVKLSAARVGELVDAGVGERFDPGHGRIRGSGCRSAATIPWRGGHWPSRQRRSWRSGPDA